MSKHPSHGPTNDTGQAVEILKEEAKTSPVSVAPALVSTVPNRDTYTTNPEKVTRSLRDIPPAHYLLKIESFSLLSQLLLDVGMKNYESDIFEASGYKWKLSLYPSGDKERKGKGHISLYLLIAETNDHNGKVKCFHLMKTEFDFPQLLPFGTFNDAANGYLIRDTCLFGAEVVMNCTGRGECLTLLKKGLDITYTWKIDKFSSLVSKIHYSDVFTIGNQEWYMLCTKCFSASTSIGWGNHSFLSFTKLHDASKGFLVKDTLIIEAEVSVLSTVNNFSK
ncbi:uncharacterized protein LOC114314038 [Camellia sinensis]|uniref:uncharacterized protein LOC114314038 n=1 Tax=Camellia sinensis TaxID=4442 RepID=UPI001035A4C9|nr:uncharacterized protein LOC114314038 [Camellia sinensis]